jgi:SAM-dependent methyltransferase/uncharacterized protein YbaR (Trm112 family)
MNNQTSMTANLKMQPIIQKDVQELLVCPTCRAQSKMAITASSLTCPDCGTEYPISAEHGIVQLLARSSKTSGKANIQAWWGDLYNQLYQQHEQTLTAESLSNMLDELENMFVARRHLAALEMPLDELRGLKVLEIGPGGGAHAALFSSKGADMVAVDITAERVIGTSIKLALCNEGGGRAYQADSENLPFQDDFFDIVYSNGVLHHSEDTVQCMSEVHRVLKPGGRAVLMVYARHSASYWLNILPRGLFSGELFRWPEAEWIGRVTEGRPKFGNTKNPYTRVYSIGELRNLVSAFAVVSFRKSSFQFDNFAVPRLTQFRNTVLAVLGRKAHPGGKLVYGHPYMVETALEVWLGKFIGFAWNIVIKKSTSSQHRETAP